MSESVPTPRRWGLPLRIGFRASFLYFSIYLLLDGNVSLLSLIPGVGNFLTQQMIHPVRLLAVWLGAHWFHLTGVAAQWHGGGSGDTALDYIRILSFGIAAAIGTVIWSVADWRRPNYQLLSAWLRFFLRLFLGLGLLAYGFAKVFPLQMREPSFAILNNTYGNSSPMTLLWTLIGLNPGYERICGAAEVLAGVLLLFRRTAVAGSLVSVVVVANVVLYNFFFDVPVKLYASHLLLISGYLLLPDAGALWRFFVLHRPAVLTGVWVPPASRRHFQIATIVVEVLFLAGTSVSLLFAEGQGWRNQRRSLVPTPITGAWQIDSVRETTPRSRLVSPEGSPWTALYVDNQRQGFYRSGDGALWRCSFKFEIDHQLVWIRGVAINAKCHWAVPDPNHLNLSVVDEKTGSTVATLVLHRLAAPERYALVDRGFHWVNEWGYER
jgi:hypothetical protein